jgi:hypothetical protein
MAKLNYEKQSSVERGRYGVILDKAEFKADLHKTYHLSLMRKKTLLRRLVVGGMP